MLLDLSFSNIDDDDDICIAIDELLSADCFPHLRYVSLKYTQLGSSSTCVVPSLARLLSHLRAKVSGRTSAPSATTLRSGVDVSNTLLATPLAVDCLRELRTFVAETGDNFLQEVLFIPVPFPSDMLFWWELLGKVMEHDLSPGEKDDVIAAHEEFSKVCTSVDE